MSFKDCPAAKKKCNTCGKEGHFASVCKSVKTNASAGLDNIEESGEETTEASSAYFFATSSVESEEDQDRQDFRLRPMST